MQRVKWSDELSVLFGGLSLSILFWGIIHAGWQYQATLLVSLVSFEGIAVSHSRRVVRATVKNIRHLD